MLTDALTDVLTGASLSQRSELLNLSTDSWTPDSWMNKPALQQPAYPDPEKLDTVVERLACLPPLVAPAEVRFLKTQLAQAARGERFLLQGGDCAESFDLCSASAVVDKLTILLRMSLALSHGAGVPVVRVGRFAGQYAKPRSSPLETRNGRTLPCYRGDLINGLPFTLADRTPDPRRMLRGYECAARTLDFIRAGEGHAGFFSSHEALLLPYEQALTRQAPRGDGWYDLSTHFPWIGMRTSDPGGAHVEYCRGISNPVAIKIGPAMTGVQLQRLLDILDPGGDPGRITLIHRLGCDHIANHLPPLIEAVQQTGRTVLWCCDPMHGNTQLTRDGIKTRHFEDIVFELGQALDIHADMGTRLGGIHIELTGDDVTECVGGAQGLTESDLKLDYRSLVDPRLNYKQSLELAMFLARRLAYHRL